MSRYDIRIVGVTRGYMDIIIIIHVYDQATTEAFARWLHRRTAVGKGHIVQFVCRIVAFSEAVSTSEK